MKFTADFHIHSHYSRATSPEMNIANLYKWGQLKGIQVMGTGDFTHPAWLNEMREKLEEAEPGFFRLKETLMKEMLPAIPPSCRAEMRFMLTVEISTIYSKNGKVRKIHSIIAAPSFAVASKITDALAKIGNLQADGRPILGLDCKELLKIVLAASPECFFIPAHIWTPYFGVFGSQSGFDSLEECFEELTPYITALETGLSSDPAMGWKLSKLDEFSFVSNSDAHSPAKLGREVNRFDTEFSYNDIRNALKKNDPEQFLETVEFFPQEGKYHLDGHRNCNVAFTPEQTLNNQGLCPKCRRKVTVGVLHRVKTLADRLNTNLRSKKIPFRYLIPLPEILADIFDVGIQSKKVMTEYFSLLTKLGNEFSILLDIPLEQVSKASSTLFAQAIEKIRTGDIHITPGFDGKYGIISVFTPEERQKNNKQTSFLDY